MEIDVYNFGDSSINNLNAHFFVEKRNDAYGSRGNVDSFHNFLGRKLFDTPSAEVMVFSENKTYIAGSAVVYRKLHINNADCLVGIMSGSWTSPENRGQGLFSKIIDASKQCVRAHQGDFLTAFVTSTNASYGRLKAAGAIEIPSYYIFHENFDDTNKNVDFEIVEDCDFRSIYEKNQSSFVYSFPDFCSQYLDKNKTCLRIANEYVLISETFNAYKVDLLTYGNIDSLEAVISGLINYKNAKGSKKLFLFSTDIDFANLCTSLGCSILNGYFMMIPVDGMLAPKNVLIQMGDKV